ncbi:MAG: oxidoreductase [Opitutaceae bacterium]|nr:oxidoreductase [Opitutaceae bacterium]|tara:strand:+ start:2618 stop:3763 length:1146 start_codon:yes stop_codon:yes gene_type:complete
MKKLNIGIIGYGFMGRTHSNAYRQVAKFFDTEYQPVLKAVCARSEDRVKAFADNWGYESYETDWRKLIERDDIDAIDIAAPNHLHREMAIAAAAAGKMVLCEKPLGMNPSEGREMADAVNKAGVPNFVWFNYRFVPAVALVKKFVDDGKLGRIYHYRANFLQDWCIEAGVPQGGEGLWRLDVNSAGSGVTGDLLAHCIDTALWINGPIESVSAMTETFVKERMHQETGKVEEVGIDDACAFLARFKNGTLATFESSRYARGHTAGYCLELNGESASVGWKLPDLHLLSYFDDNDGSAVRGWRSIHVSQNDGEHPYMANWWVPGIVVGFEHTFTHGAYQFLKSLEDNTHDRQYSNFEDALKTDEVCAAVLESARTQSWQTIA